MEVKQVYRGYYYNINSVHLFFYSVVLCVTKTETFIS